MQLRVIFKERKSDRIGLRSESLTGSSSSQPCRQTQWAVSHCCEGDVLSSPSRCPCPCPGGLWHWYKAELCFPESVPSIHFGCLVLGWEKIHTHTHTHFLKL